MNYPSTSNLTQISYFLISDLDDSQLLRIKNYFYRNPVLPLDKLLPYPLFSNYSFDLWQRLYWGCSTNPKLFSISETNSSILISFSIETSYILSTNYIYLWAAILSTHFSVNLSYITDLSVMSH